MNITFRVLVTILAATVGLGGAMNAAAQQKASAPAAKKQATELGS